MKKLVLLAIINFVVFARTQVRVGGYIFPPYVNNNQTGNFKGISVELTELLNKIQKDYEFKFVPISAKRRYQEISQKNIDLILFESKAWGWKNNSQVEFSKVFLNDGEVFITFNDKKKDQNYFKDIKGKSIALYLGYHYAFADFNSDEDYLKKNFNAYISVSHQKNILQVLKNRVDLAIVTLSYLNMYINRNDKIKRNILISSSLDQKYDHTILVRKSGKISLEKINEIIRTFKSDKRYEDLLKKYGLSDFKY